MRGTGVWIEAAGEEDLPELLRLERSSFSSPWTEEHFRQDLRGSHRILVMRAPGPALAAYCAMARVLDELHVHNLTVCPRLRRQGLGLRLLRQVLDLAARGGARSAFLEVRRSNRAARGLYAAAGFDAVGVRRDYYSQPVEDALVLRRDGLGEDPGVAPGDP